MLKYFNNASHEARTLMTGIVGVAQVMLNSDEITTESRENVKIIINNSYSLLVLFEDMIDTVQTRMKKAS